MNKWKETLSILLISVSFIALILFIQPNNNLISEFKTQIPKTTTEHYLLNPSSLIKKLIFNELFVSEDEVLIQKIKDLVSGDSKNEPILSDINVDFAAPLEVIRFKRNAKTYTVIKFRVLNTTDFDQNQHKKNGSLIFRNKLNGFWVLGELKNRKSIFQKYLLNNSFEYKLKNDESKQFVSTFRNSKLVTFGCIYAKENFLKIEQKITEFQNHRCLKPNGFHLSTVINSSQFGSLKRIRVSDLIHSKELKYISLNYSGLDFIDDPEIQAIPKFDILLCYKNKISGDSVLSNILNHYNLPFESKSKQDFRIGTQSITIKQIDTNQFIISTLNNFEMTNTFLNPSIKGDPKNIVKFTNAGWKGLFLELIPGFKASKNFLESTDKISTYQNKNGFQVICLSFNKNENALHNLLKFALNLR
jgi:hypothetical protein